MVKFQSTKWSTDSLKPWKKAGDIFKRIITLFVFFLGAALSLPAQDEPSGSTLQMIANVGNGYTCGVYGTTPLFCPGLPLRFPDNTTGSMFLSTDLGNPFGTTANTHSILWYAADLGATNITSAVLSPDGSTLTVQFTGTTNDRDLGSFTGTATLTFKKMTRSSGGGRGGHSTITVLVCTGGSVTIKYQ